MRERMPLRPVQRTAPGGREITLVPAYAGGQRLDAFLTRVVGGRSRSDWQRLVELGAVTLNGHRVKPSARVWPGGRVAVAPTPPHVELRPASEIPLDVMYEDAAMIVVNKPAGLVVHPAPGHQEGTLVNALLARYPELRDPTGELRPGIVHRLDKDTSGLMVVGRTTEAIAELQRQMKEREVHKRYQLLVLGLISEDEAVIDAPIGRDLRHRQKMAVRADARPAQTRFRVLERFLDCTLVDAALDTGRTHQLRVHFAYIGHPVAADATYGSGRAIAGLKRQFVHSHALTLRSPVDGQIHEFQIPLAPDLEAAVTSLRKARDAKSHA